MAHHDALVADDGETVTLSRRDLPSIANPRAFEVVLTLDEVEGIYNHMRARSLGADSRGDL